MVGNDDLVHRAREAAKGSNAPKPDWGESVELGVGGTWLGRFRGEDIDRYGNPIYLYWEADGAPVFFWHAYRLQQGMENAAPSVGDWVCVYRDENYLSKHDTTAPTGKAYGVSSKHCDDPLPNDGEDGAATANRPPELSRAAGTGADAEAQAQSLY